MKNKAQDYIIIEKAKENNLKDVSLKIPHHKINCFTGVSGSGKSSLVYDIICKESQRRYFESFSSYARQFLGKMSRPEVEKIEGLMPAISVDQKTVSRNPRSTVGTISEIYDYLRLLFARTGKKSSAFSDVKLTRSLFSFNNPEGACPHCKGLGVEDQIDPELLIKDPAKSLREGALKITTPSGYTIYSQVTIDVLNQVCKSEGFHVDIPWQDLTEAQKDIIFNGSNKIKIPFGKHTLESRMKWSGITAKPREEGYYKGILPIMENILRVDRNPNILRFAKTVKCSSCQGKRLNDEALSVTINHKNIIEYSSLSIANLKKELLVFDYSDIQQEVAQPIIEKIIDRCIILENLGLGYLTLMRESTSLSGGEAQRIRLATQVGNKLRGMLYILDEPSIGLHPRDNKRMLEIIEQLRNQGNTVLVVEHDKETMLHADQIIDIGPYAGKDGGQILFNAANSAILQLKNINSQTLKYLQKETTDSYYQGELQNKWLTIKGAHLHNLKNIDVQFRLHALNVVTGVSGAGKSTLVFDTLGKYYSDKLSNNTHKNASFDEISADTKVQKIIEIDQTPIGKTSRSNPATYTKLFDQIRKLFASLPESKQRKWNQSHYSFNTKGGRCETCEGAGYTQTGMHFLSNVETICETCDGKRYDEETLEVKYKGKNISEILEMEISDACDFFKDEPKISHYLEVMQELGLGYLSLGQSSTTLSGGEAQRLKLATQLVKPSKNHTLYIFDEPTTGLHPYDVSILLSALRNLTKNGHTVIVIEHDFGIIKNADHIVDLGPEGGDQGGKVIFSGTYKNLLNCKTSHTTKALLEEKSHVTTHPKEDIEEIINAPIKLKGIKTHNLKNIDVEIPRNQLTVITGVSGSGKSSLAFDTLFAEGQYRYTESFSTYARSMIQQKVRPDIAENLGLTPTIAINNQSITKNPRATVGTVSGLYDLYRLIYSRISKDQHNEPCTILSNHFSFNHEAGACPVCNGLGFELTCDPDKLITNPELPIHQGAMKGSKPGQFYGDPYGQYMAILNAVGKKLNINLSIPWIDLDKETKDIILQGTGDREYDVQWKYKRKNREGVHQFKSTWPGLIYYINDEYIRKHDKQGGKNVAALMKEVRCTTCQGSRLNTNILEYTIDGKNIAELSNLESTESLLFFENLKNKLSEKEHKIAQEIIRSCQDKLNALIEIGLGYLKPNRTTLSLSGGEGRRLRLVSQLGGELKGITYVLDEPTVGLHSKDTQNLIHLIKELAQENTVVVVEHDKEVIQSADYVIELGPGAGTEGGEVVYANQYNDFIKHTNSVTAKYLQTNFSFDCPKTDLDISFGLFIKAAYANNLKNVDLDLPTNGITAFSGVSGSGKSSLLFDVIAESAQTGRAIHCNEISGLDQFESVIKMDQSPIGRNPSSTPLTFLGLYDIIRDLFASTEKAKKLNFKKSHFSYNTKGGRCETCKGQGKIKISMDFLSDVWITCSDCNGHRFKEEILEVTWNNYSIANILELTINQASDIFKEETKLHEAFMLLNDLGLGHLKLGQSATALSGGEAQRLKLAKELIKKPKGQCLYLLDEPTTGLHFYDIEKLLNILFKLRDQGHALYIIEHHPWLIKVADHVVELGPEGGEKGGYIMD
ncbi:MAG: excinuclease ABC subunit UvrA [Bacteroidetes bacterium]|nr:excinuclease ABC subunit UvrA [Bacteroidota bacterium]